MPTAVVQLWCIVHGTQGSSNFSIEGPFDSLVDAQTNADRDVLATGISALVFPLVNSASC